MKTLISTLVLALALCGWHSATAQNARVASRAAADSVLLSQQRDGNYMVRKYLVKRGCDRNSDFAVRYRINLSTLAPASFDNGRELAALNAFMDSLMRDTLMHVQSVTITGYASPDGLEASNQKLARARAMDFKKYLDNKYGLSKKYSVKINAVVDDWDSCVNGLNRSNLANREKAVNVINSRAAMADKERELKTLPQVWEYLAANVLPALRQADIEFEYGRDAIAVTRTQIEQPKVAANTRPAAPVNNTNCPPPSDDNRCCCCGEVITEQMIIVDDMSNGLIVEMGEVDIDF